MLMRMRRRLYGKRKKKHMRQERRYYQTVGRIYFFELYKALYRMIAKLCERYDIQLLVMLNQTQESSLIYQLD